MSKIEQLIKEKCPNGVEYKKIWEVTTWDKKYNSTEKYMQPQIHKYKYLLANQINDILVENGDIFVLETGINVEKKYTTEKLAKDYLCEGEIVAIPWGGTPNVKYYNGKFVTGDNRIAISNDTNVLLNKFLYYFLDNKIKTIGKFYRGSGIKHPEMKKILMLNIPIPPIEVQKEIVKILDKFSELETELGTELEIRKKQYEFWNAKIFNSNMKKYKLGELCNITSGGTPSKRNSEYWENGNIKWLGSSVCKSKKQVDEITDYITDLGLNKSSAKLLKPGTTLIAMVGATIGKVAYLNFEACTNQNIASLWPKSEKILNNEYLFYACSNLYNDFLNLAKGGFAMANLRFIKNLEIPVPPLQEQERIVKILDKFDKLINDISEGIPAEIEARKKQYEYYRNKLLSFEELKTND